MKYPKGSAGEAEQKDTRVVLVGAAVVAILILSLQFLIPGTTIYNSVHDAKMIFRIIGGLMVAGSVVPLIVAFGTPDDAKPFVWAWLILLVLGLLISVQFFDTPNDYRLN